MDSTGSRLATPRPVPVAAVGSAPRTIGEWLARPGAHSVRRAWDLITTSTAPVLLTGPAGTGKSLLLKLFLQHASVRTVVLASTGISALQIGGQTVHRFFRLPPRIITPGDLSQPDRLAMYAAADVYVVDEVSMLRADVIDAMDLLLRRARSSGAAFGGARLLLVGDPYQLAPVVTETEATAGRALGYASAWFFHAKVFDRVPLRVAPLDQIHRQRDPAFARLLSRMRTGHLANTDFRVLQDLVRPASARGEDAPLMLTTTRKAAAAKNGRRLEALPGRSVTYRGTVEGAFPRRELPVPQALELRVGARVVMVRNDVERRWANGTVGTVTRCGEQHVLVRPDGNDEEHLVVPVTWERVRYVHGPRTRPPAVQVMGRYTQLPCLLGWAMTIHRSQGLTLDRVRVDLAGGAFAPGQTYVSLSRVRSREGLELVRPVRPEDVLVDSAVARFLAEREAEERTHEAA